MNNVDTNQPWNEQVFSSHYLFEKCHHMMKKKGYVLRTKVVWSGEIRVTWRKLSPVPSTLDSDARIWDH